MENFGRCSHNFSGCLGLIIAEEYTMKRLLKRLAITSLAVAGFAAVGSAQTAPPVVENQRARVRQGVRDGSLTPAEAKRLRGRERRLQRRANRDRRSNDPTTDLGGAYNEFWFDRGTKVVPTRRTSLVVDPPDGRVPPLTPAAQKAAATRKRNEAKRRRSAKKAAETRARAEQSRLKVVALEAERVADTAVGAVVAGGEKVVDTLKPLRSQTDARREAQRIQRRATTNLRRFERRGATARKQAERTVKRQRDQALRTLRRNRRDAERQVKTARRDVEHRFDEVQESAEDLFRRATPQATSSTR